MLDVLQDEVMKREIWFASDDLEAARFVLHPRFRTRCALVCRNGGGIFQGSGKSVLEYFLDRFGA